MTLTKRQLWLAVLILAIAFSVVDLVLFAYGQLSFFIIVVFLLVYVMILNITRLLARPASVS